MKFRFMTVRMRGMSRADGNGAQCEPSTNVLVDPTERAGCSQPLPF
jgi:hypothetical protein